VFIVWREFYRLLTPKPSRSFQWRTVDAHHHSKHHGPTRGTTPPASSRTLEEAQECTSGLMLRRSTRVHKWPHALHDVMRCPWNQARREARRRHVVTGAPWRWHWPAEASLRERGAGPAAYIQTYTDEDGPAKQVQSLHHNLNTSMDSQLLNLLLLQKASL
jgi:hypothetical protein